jgi:hypothetical protein
VSALLLLSSGCSQMCRPEQRAAGEAADPDAFIHEHLQKQAVVTVGEAYRAMIMLANGEDKYTSFEEREAVLLCRGIVRSAWKLCPDEAVDRGTVAYMAMRIMEIRGGVNAQILGRAGIGDRRYALRELAYMDLMPLGPVYRYVTGGEVVDLMARADEYMARRKQYELEPVDIEQTVEGQRQRATTQP